MKKIIFTIGISGLIFISGFYINQNFHNSNHNLEKANTEVKKLINNNEIKSGDLIFQTSLSGQSKAIQLATNSKYSHCGIVYKEKGEFYVFEAIQPVKITPINKWISNGKDGHFVIKRLKKSNEILTKETLQKMKNEGEKFIGKNYDFAFEWSDDKIYCSELIWKIYKRSTGIEIGKLEKLSDFDLTNEGYGNKIPTEEVVISPKAIFESNLLIRVN